MVNSGFVKTCNELVTFNSNLFLVSHFSLVQTFCHKYWLYIDSLDRVSIVREWEWTRTPVGGQCQAWRSRVTTWPLKWNQLCSCQQQFFFSGKLFFGINFFRNYDTFLFYFFRFFLASTLDGMVKEYQEDTTGFIKGQ